jgi:hypothetical protein
MALDYGCVKAERAINDGLFFCGAHLSYGYNREGICHAATVTRIDGHLIRPATRAYDGPVASPFVRRALARQLPAADLTGHRGPVL